MYWEFITENLDVNSDYDTFLLLFNTIVNDCAPYDVVLNVMIIILVNPG